MKIIANNLMVRFDRDNDELLLANGQKLHLATGWEPYQHAVTSGVVTAVPDKIIFDRRDHRRSVLYDTDMEIQLGDRVIFDFKVEEHVRKVAPIDGSYPLRYDDIFVVIRGEQIIPVNGIILVEACDTTIEEDVRRVLDSGLNLPETVTKEKSERYGIVRHIGTPLRGYLQAPEDLDELSDVVNVGDKIVFHPTYAVELQYSLHQIIEKGKTLYRMRRKDVFAVMSEV
jgi:hypothetical protein